MSGHHNTDTPKHRPDLTSLGLLSVVATLAAGCTPAPAPFPAAPLVTVQHVPPPPPASVHVTSPPSAKPAHVASWRREEVVAALNRVSRAVIATHARTSRTCPPTKDVWACLRIDEPVVPPFHFTYRQGGDYVGPAVGGVDPGPGGIEVAASADFPSGSCVFARTATPHPTLGLRWGTQVVASEGCPPK